MTKGLSQLPENNSNLIVKPQSRLIRLLLYSLPRTRKYYRGFLERKLSEDFITRLRNELTLTGKKFKAIIDNVSTYLISDDLAADELFIVNIDQCRNYYDYSENSFSFLIQYLYEEHELNDKPEIFADVFLIKKKYFVAVRLGDKGLIRRSEHIIKKDIKN